MNISRQKFATQVEATLLAEIRRTAEEDGRQLQAVIEDALRIYLEERRRATPRRHIMAHYQASHDHYATLYERLAK
ncbi:MAG: hypothetical protein DCC73_02355 [Proteobacteria bacterium]|jgi:hypothetical protein|nr:MAG: hypothetical protein DCC73_02355 [Pseudomonadota bacterium]